MVAYIRVDFVIVYVINIALFLNGWCTHFIHSFFMNLLQLSSHLVQFTWCKFHFKKMATYSCDISVL